MIKTWLGSLFGVKKAVEKKGKLTDEDRRNIVTDYMINKMNQQAIAKKYGVSQALVSKIYRKAMHEKSQRY